MVKVISLSNEAYEKLERIKENMSFSELIVNLIKEKEKRKIEDFVGVWSDEEGKKIKEKISENRKKQKIKKADL